MKSRFRTKILICADCGEEFVFTASAQEYFEERGFRKAPRRCRFCHSLHRKERQQNGDKLEVCA